MRCPDLFFRRIVALFALGAGLAPGRIGGDGEEVRIGPDPNVEARRLRAYYFIVGDFGGYGGSREADKELDVSLPTYVGDRRARSVKAVVYAEGCEIRTFVLDPLPPGPSRLLFECRKLDTVWLRGIVVGHARPSELRIHLHYVGSWNGRFLGFGDGPSLTIHIADAVPHPDGRFAVEVPDFAKDTITKSHREEAYWRITASGTGPNESYCLKPDRPASTLPCTLAFEPEYSGELQFTVDRF